MGHCHRHGSLLPCASDFQVSSRTASRVFVLTALLGLGAACPTARANTYQWRTDAPSNDWASGSYSVHSLNFRSATNGYDFNQGSLTLGTGGIYQNSAYEEIFDIPVSLGSNPAWARRCWA